MDRLFAHFYDRFMAGTEEACLRQWRAELLAHANGDVLEIGAGTGANVTFYPPDAKLTLCEPSPAMRAILAQNAPNAVLCASEAEELPFADASFDSVVTTLVLCTVKSPAASLAEVARVLRPDGRLFFLEHVVSHDPKRRRWQKVLDPAWSRFAGGCHCCRDTEHALKQAGFVVESIARESMRKAFPILRPTIRGVARVDHAGAR